MNSSKHPLEKIINAPLIRKVIAIAAFIPMFSHASIADENFIQCKANLAERADNAGFPSYITQTVIGNITPLKRVIALDKKQPEFTQTFEQYIKARVTEYHVRVGKEKLKREETIPQKNIQASKKIKLDM